METNECDKLILSVIKESLLESIFSLQQLKVEASHKHLQCIHKDQVPCVDKDCFVKALGEREVTF
jgi:hypothetical protein